MDLDWPALWALACAPEQPAEPASTAGRPRCTGHNAQTGAPCKNFPIHGHHVCHAHGGRAPQVRAKAAQRVQEAEALKLARQAGNGADVERMSGDPVAALQWVISESHGLTARLAKIVRDDITDADLRYSGKLGEQTRGELTALLRAMKDLSSMSERAIALGIQQRRAALKESELDMLEDAFDRALAASGASLEGQAKARQVLAQRLKAADTVIQGEVA
jgi:hypothetical protein